MGTDKTRPRCLPAVSIDPSANLVRFPGPVEALRVTASMRLHHPTNLGPYDVSSFRKIRLLYSMHPGGCPFSLGVYQQDPVEGFLVPLDVLSEASTAPSSAGSRLYDLPGSAVHFNGAASTCDSDVTIVVYGSN